MAEPTFTATISGFTNGETLGTSDVTGTASCSTDALIGSAPGTYTITCSQGTLDSTNYDFTTFNTGVETITKATSSVSVTSDHNPSVFGQPVTFTAMISGFGGGSSSGSVDFVIDGGSPITVTVAGDQAQYSTSTLAVGNHTVHVDYSGDGNLTGSSDDLSGGQQVNKATTTVSITNAASISSTDTVVGESYEVFVTVTADSPSLATPTGSVSVSDGTGATCVVTLVSGAGSCFLPSLTAGSKTVTATYATNGSFIGDSDTTSHTVTIVGTTVSITSDVNPSVFGQTVTFTAHAASVSPGTNVPVGTVEFFVDGISAGTVPVDGSGDALFITNSLTVGTRHIDATFTDAGNYDTSNATTFDQTVDQADTTTSLVSDLNPSIYGDNVTFTATVAAVFPGSGIPTGTVEFFDGATSLGTDTLDPLGEATLSTPTLGAGSTRSPPSISAPGRTSTAPVATSRKSSARRRSRSPPTTGPRRTARHGHLRGHRVHHRRRCWSTATRSPA